MSAASLFHPAVAAWFETSFAAATAAQADAWPLLKAGRHTVIAALTGGEIRFVEQLDPATEWFDRKALVRGTGRGSSLFAERASAPDTAPAGS
jgi:hypothetical protein